MIPQAYRICFERVPSYHPLGQKRSYRRRIAQRDMLCVHLQQRPIPQGWQGFIVEVNTSFLWAVERPQLVLGAIEERVRVRLKDPTHPELGSRGLEVVHEETFVESERSLFGAPGTVYTDERLVVEVEALGRSALRLEPAERDLAKPSQPHLLPMRRTRPVERAASDLDEVPGRTFTTGGELFPVSSTSSGTPLAVHMLVRLLVPQDYPLAIARSYLGARRSFAPDEAFANRKVFGVCYELLYMPSRDREG